MITPIELHNKQHKTGRGYNKKEMDIFLDEVLSNYETLYKENAELKEKITQLSDGIQYYKAMETTLQKALVLAEKTSKDTIESANAKAEVIEKEAHLKADTIVNNAISKREEIKKECISLLQQYKQFKAQFKQIAQKQIELLDGNFYEIYSKDLIDAINDVNYTSNQENKQENVEKDEKSEVASEVAELSENDKVIDNVVESNTPVKDVKIIESSYNTEINPEISHEHVIEEDIDESVIKGDTKEFAPIEIEIISKNTESDNNQQQVSSKVVENTDTEENKEDDEDDDPFNKIIRELKEDLAQELANSESNSSFEFIDNE